MNLEELKLCWQRAASEIGKFVPHSLEWGIKRGDRNIEVPPGGSGLSWWRDMKACPEDIRALLEAGRFPSQQSLKIINQAIMLTGLMISLEVSDLLSKRYGRLASGHTETEIKKAAAEAAAAKFAKTARDWRRQAPQFAS